MTEDNGNERLDYEFFVDLFLAIDPVQSIYLRLPSSIIVDVGELTYSSNGAVCALLLETLDLKLDTSTLPDDEEPLDDFWFFLASPLCPC